MKYLKPTLIIGGLSIIGIALYRYYQKQLNFLNNIQYKLVGLSIANISKEAVSIDITQSIYNTSNVEATITEMYLDLYINGIKVGNVEEVKDILILPTKSTNLSYRLTFDPSLILKNVVNLVTLTMALKDFNIKAEGYIKLHSGFIYTTLPFSYENNLKSILK